MNLSPHLLCEEEAHPRGKILRFAGEADFIAVPAVRQLLKKLLGQRIPFLIVDLSAVTFLNLKLPRFLNALFLKGFTGICDNTLSTLSFSPVRTIFWMTSFAKKSMKSRLVTSLFTPLQI